MTKTKKIIPRSRFGFGTLAAVATCLGGTAGALHAQAVDKPPSPLADSQLTW